ncbi:hypothetical protein LH51_12660 [Nitrincola sp. A-D6]|uniref:CRISPR-associated helicase/endonuclease Cas3 n=1 Tax=Nitrincola sp. A-D6 TaxID=1545442 RepID=UPI00051FC510|nr:CRISPR-associated helicase/endonuclease Cas3 [Nitrincola sp. A-D6]KGK41715.1 hypothetical protein LH51_12660 [Nitrincola sp. A-D6]
MKINSLGYFDYWGKVSKESECSDPDFHLLVYHSLDVAAVGWHLLNEQSSLCQDLANFIGITASELRSIFTFLLILHDIGKFPAAFQNLYPLEKLNLPPLKSAKPYDGKLARHDRLGWGIWKQAYDEGLLNLNLLTNSEINTRILNKTLEALLDCSWGHHGKPILHGRTIDLEDYWVEKNVHDAVLFIQDASQLVELNWPSQLFEKETLSRLKQVSWHLAGLAVLCDWLGSNTSYFPYCSDKKTLSSYWPEALQKAQTAIQQTDLFNTYAVQPFSSFEQQFSYSPTPLQRWSASVEIESGPQLFILEDVTGAGKTEAALCLTQRLMSEGLADGFYFGLPSMATSNAMFERISQHYLTMFQQRKPSLVLAHGARDMHQHFREMVIAETRPDVDYQSAESSATASCNQWFADSRKKALLAPVGVGTVDQALLAVLPRRHQALRMIGLHRKVLIFDEVHAADEFMLELLYDLLALHVRQGGCAILLTATLPIRQRQRLCNRWLQTLGWEQSETEYETGFPLATQVSMSGVKQQVVASRPEVSRSLEVQFLSSVEGCLDVIQKALASDQCVVWICNSVSDALEAYQQVLAVVPEPERCLLFHSRFTLLDRQRIENDVLDCLGKKSSPAQRRGRVVVSTQVFQESLDADADVMLSDICPIDDLIQRAGRLHRHTRTRDGQYQPNMTDQRDAPVLYVHAPEWSETPSENWLKSGFRNTQAVYRSPGRLWLGMQALREAGAIRMPSEARVLIEAVYGDEAYDNIPTALQQLEDLHQGDINRKTNKASQQLIDWGQGYGASRTAQWFDDDTDISTRFSDIETVEVLVLKRGVDGGVVFWAEVYPYPLAMSVLKLPKHHADKLQLLEAVDPESAEAFRLCYRQSKYYRLWLAEDDPQYTYSADIGFA